MRNHGMFGRNSSRNPRIQASFLLISRAALLSILLSRTARDALYRVISRSRRRARGGTAIYMYGTDVPRYDTTTNTFIVMPCYLKVMNQKLSTRSSVLEKRSRHKPKNHVYRALYISAYPFCSPVYPANNRVVNQDIFFENRSKQRENIKKLNQRLKPPSYAFQVPQEHATALYIDRQRGQSKPRYEGARKRDTGWSVIHPRASNAPNRLASFLAITPQQTCPVELNLNIRKDVLVGKKECGKKSAAKYCMIFAEFYHY